MDGFRGTTTSDRIVPLQILADMNISPLTANAAETDQIVCTQDLDFSALLAVSGRARPSPIALRLSNPAPQIVTERLLDVLPTVTEDVQQGAVVIVEDRATRVRSLPIQG